ncbi:type III secretion protein [Caulobacter zeae]|jgi:flagellar biosynthesis protein|uniref:Type III secretion protein n=3 Tax=Caulobacter TaxID=75 RepID=A0A2T9JW69_9CAUL|nr:MULTISPECIES: EscU/YscU/HrcU family type III secretion system export apparatus switch protein [Caulobacter]MDG2529537.1 EscU/YscU/HrcU family type III secretion system export apparatus switch protein [Caulobacter endophyticus]NGM48139.1 type III secretion protein [Caulobacter sp. 602-2]PLR19319.1 type III secretion protein [Caulobacter zeae]PVM87958.1 type III secretion protein [Caulobacter radicis]PVM88929.1 type III secretion protein [Caulobacter radicis]
MTRVSGPRIAVALRYDEPNAPRVVASGRGWVGDKIVETAREHGVPLEENPALAQALSTIPMEEEIPEALYVAVAEILGFILRSANRN